ncbi:MAG TPA: AEC family transporter [Petrotogaceae bacterium]|jgi:hypothetical protein|nr:AEC family transporter [Petrotogaceae bacterium]HQF32293.1 AEC family transporter [Petrotogaceae bacterium]HQH32361.1 AEC family transporter [Petrotogaceae bacterium]HQI77982.1 AEC family transporter [Petrotogaceae bacterium]
MLFITTIYRIVPIFLIIFLGFALGKIFKTLDHKLLGKLTLYLFGTIIAFVNVNLNPPSGQDFFNYLFAFLIIFVIFTIMIIVLKKLRVYKYDTGVAVNLVTHLNAGYLGYPIITVLYGEEYIRIGVIYSITMTLIMSSIGIVMLSGDIKNGLKNMVKLPLIHGFLAGWLLAAVGVNYQNLPFLVSYPIDMLNDAAITFILIYIGVTLSRVKLSPSNLKQTVLLTALKLLFLPVLGFLAVSIIPMEPMYRKIFLLETAMPTAMNMVVVTAELNKEPEVGSLVVFFTTAFSVLTIPFWSIFI